MGCRYKRIQRQRFPQIPSTDLEAQHHLLLQESRAAFVAALPRYPSIGDAVKDFSFVDVHHDYLDTLEALAGGFTVIANPLLCWHGAGQEPGMEIALEALVRTGSGLYAPVLVSSHRVTQSSSQRTVSCISVSRLGLGRPVTRHAALRHHTLDGYALGLAARALGELGVDSGKGGVVGQDMQWVVLVDTATYQPALEKALKAAVAPRARRVRECARCRYWAQCEKELQQADDISLLLPGDKANPYRRRGITTVSALAASGREPNATVARAWQQGEEFVRRETGFRTRIPRAEVELDIDMEAYRDQAAYLWGVFDGKSYHPFVTWDLSEEAVAANFANFWGFLRTRREEARQAGCSYCAYCYSHQAENHWLVRSAQLYAGRPGVPTVEEVREFISSNQWVDVFQLVRSRLVGVHGTGLKAVAKAAGYEWDQADLAGEGSIFAFKEAREDPAMQAKIVSYNRDDCQATARVRQWLDDAAPGVVVSIP